MGRRVTVTGQGEASAPYDQATLALGVTARAAVPSDATARAGYALGQVRDAVLARGVPPTALSTGAVSLTPVHDPWPTVVAYEASFALRVRTEDIAAVGTLLVAAVDAGGDSARVDGLTFGHRDAEALEHAARDAAYADALSKARQYAGLAGQALGEVRGVVEGSTAAAPRPLYRMADTAAVREVSLDGGEGSVQAVVTVTWALGPAV